MAKWQSVIFSGASGKLGNQVVFGNWKGRNYIRQYAKPTNPNTNKQKAQRALMKALVQRYKTIINTAAVKQLWNDLAAEFQVSGYNLFISEGLRAEISCPESLSGAAPVSVTITYNIEFNPADAIIVREDEDGNLTDITPAEGLQPSGTITDTINTSGTYTYYIGDKRALLEGDTAPQPYQLLTKYSKDEANGTIKEAKCTVTIS